MRRKSLRALREVTSFFVPKNVIYKQKFELFNGLNVAVVIPTYKPSYLTRLLINSLNNWYENVKVIVVDDSAGESEGRYKETFQKIIELARKSRKIYYIKTPKNLYKPGALNYGFEFVKKLNEKTKINAVVTTDDDVIVSKSTIPTLVNNLYSSFEIGAVCSTARVKNKNKNLLTRLQGLEYHNFNIIKLSDNGLFKGPLVMQGMISAFKMSAFIDVGGYATKNLIEDYEITANLKKHGWSVFFVPDCWAWTNVPHEFNALWKQRVRWTYWGLEVINSYYKDLIPVVQDLIGHLVFIAMLLFIGLSLATPSTVVVGKTILLALLAVAFFQFSISYLFNLYTLRFYKDADWTDHLLRLSIIPELIYSNIMSLILVGSYLFYLFNVLFGKGERLRKIYTTSVKLFEKLGYSLTWGTRDLAFVSERGGEIYE